MVASARIGLALLALVLSTPVARAQATPPARAEDQPRFIRVVAKDYTFDAPVTVQAGVGTIHLVNQGADIHHVTVQALPQGRTVRQFLDAVNSTGRAPVWSRSVSQTAAIANGGEAFIAFRLQPGQYVLTCLLPAADGRSHVSKGMFQLITVTPAQAATPRPTSAPGGTAPATAAPRPATPRPTSPQ